MWLLTTLLLLGSYWGSGAHTITHGVLVHPSENLELVSQHHNVILTLNLTRALNLVRNMQLEVRNAGTYVPRNHALSQKFMHQLSPLREALANKEKAILNFITAHEDRKPTKRKRRNSYIGNAVSALFGLATEDELNDLVKNVDHEFTQQARVLDHDLSVLSITEKQTEQLAHAYRKTSIAVTALKNHVGRLDQVMRNMSRDLVLATVLNFADIGTNRAVTEVDRILSVLEQTVLSTTVSPDLLSPQKLKEVLQLMQARAINLVFPPVDAFLPEYFQAARVRIKIKNRLAILVVRLPVKSEQSYDLFETTKYWVPYNNSLWSRRIVDEPRFVAVRKDQKMALFLKSLSGCVRTRSGILCDPITNFLSYDLESCILNILKGKDTDDLCAFAYRKASPPDFRRMGNHWIGSLQEATTVAEVCPSKTPRKIEIPAGISVLPVKDRCEYIADTFALPAMGVRGETHMEVRTIVEPYHITPLDHLGIPSLPEDRIPKLKVYREEKLRLLALDHHLRSGRITEQTNVNSAFLLTCFLVLVGLIIMIKCRHRCGDCSWIQRRISPYRTPPRPMPRTTPSQIIDEIRGAVRDIREEEKSKSNRLACAQLGYNSPSLLQPPTASGPLDPPKSEDLPDYVEMIPVRPPAKPARKKTMDDAGPSRKKTSTTGASTLTSP